VHEALAPHPDDFVLERTVGIGRAKLMEVLRVLERQLSIVRVGADLYFLTESLDHVRRVLHEHFADPNMPSYQKIPDLFLRDLIDSAIAVSSVHCHGA
jgi:hypothetical protein